MWVLGMALLVIIAIVVAVDQWIRRTVNKVKWWPS